MKTTEAECQKVHMFSRDKQSDDGAPILAIKVEVNIGATSKLNWASCITTNCHLLN